ncbi:MAG: Gfo/Idh/MocA family oxidoreductase [Melioribacteraceae bacterium]|nr:MAG: Gfo/Idh/MocA family oxidoreductase [Melioribacteraceae bacterium]
MNRILIVGLGSIGLRHLNCLLEIGEYNIGALRTNRGTLTPDLSLLEKIKIFTDLNEAIGWNPTHVIISNPTSLHSHYFKIFSKLNLQVFVEKPFLGDIDLTLLSDDFLNIIKNTPGMVGFNLRFHGLFREIKKIIQSSVYGKPLSACLMVGYYLPFWHPYEDYRKSYVANKNLGGGAIRTLSHEIDLSQYLFGKFKKVFTKLGKVSELEIDVDDTADILLETELCTRISIHNDLLSPQIKRKGYIYFEKGYLEYDFINAEINYTSYEMRQPQVIYNQKEDYDLQYKSQMTDFLRNCNDTGCTFSEGLEVDKLIAYSMISNNNGVEICLI